MALKSGVSAMLMSSGTRLITETVQGSFGDPDLTEARRLIVSCVVRGAYLSRVGWDSIIFLIGMAGSIVSVVGERLNEEKIASTFCWKKVAISSQSSGKL